MTEWQRLNQLLATEYDPTQYYLGKVCKKEDHRFHKAPFSVRRNCDRSCLECSIQKGRDWHKQNNDKSKAISQNWRSTNLEQARALVNQWGKDNPEKRRIHKLTRRTKQRKGAIEVISPDDLIRRYRSDFNRCCAYCQGFIYYNQVQWDHVIAIANGGSNSLNNLVPTCKACNLSKHDSDVFEWLTKKGYPMPTWLTLGV